MEQEQRNKNMAAVDLKEGKQKDLNNIDFLGLNSN